MRLVALRLARDPGVTSVMAAHRYSVGLLREMPPEGKVGISPVCVLGLNTSQGQVRWEPASGRMPPRHACMHACMHTPYSHYG